MRYPRQTCHSAFCQGIFTWPGESKESVLERDIMLRTLQKLNESFRSHHLKKKSMINELYPSFLVIFWPFCLNSFHLCFFSRQNCVENEKHTKKQTCQGNKRQTNKETSRGKDQRRKQRTCRMPRKNEETHDRIENGNFSHRSSICKAYFELVLKRCISLHDECGILLEYFSISAQRKTRNE